MFTSAIPKFSALQHHALSNTSANINIRDLNFRWYNQMLCNSWLECLVHETHAVKVFLYTTYTLIFSLYDYFIQCTVDYIIPELPVVSWLWIKSYSVGLMQWLETWWFISSLPPFTKNKRTSINWIISAGMSDAIKARENLLVTFSSIRQIFNSACFTRWVQWKCAIQMQDLDLLVTQRIFRKPVSNQIKILPIS